MDQASGITKIVCHKHKQEVNEFKSKGQNYIMPDSLCEGAYKIFDYKIVILNAY